MVYTEGRPILCGENTWDIFIQNTWGPGYPTLWSPFYQDFDHKPNQRLQLSPAIPGVLPLLRKFFIDISYTDRDEVSSMREAVRRVASRLQMVANIDLIRLNYCSFCVEDGDEDELIMMLQTWLGRVRNVKKVVIEVMSSDEDSELPEARFPEPHAEIIKRRWMSSEPLEKTPLPSMYAILEKHA